MKNLMDWIKSNPFIVACGGVAAIGLVGCAYLLLIAAPGFTETRSEPLKKYGTQQRSFMNIPVPLPNEDPNAPPDTESVVVNDVVITEVSNIYDEIKNQYSSILTGTTDKNAKQHRAVLLGGVEIWPDKDPTRFFALYEKASEDYRDHFKAAFAYGKANPWGIPPMLASNPPTPQQIEQALAASALNFLRSIGASNETSLTESQALQLFAVQRRVLMALLTDRASRIHLYASLPKEEDPFAPAEPEDGVSAPDPGAGSLLLGGTPNQPGQSAKGLPVGYPFQIADWAYAETAPNPDQLWEGQVQLWVMRDILQTIARVNNVNGPNPTSVLDNPVKRLLAIEDIPGYIGMHTVGGVFDQAGLAGLAQPGSASSTRGGFGTGGSGSGESTSIYPSAPTELAPLEPTAQALEHFGITPTGRISNAVFDVRHTKLTIDIAWSDLPRFIQELRETNFMTVIDLEVQDLDEYALLREGYIYGKSDVVRAEMLIESLWFREWTGPLMPKVVRQKLLIEPDPAAQPGTTGP